MIDTGEVLDCAMDDWGELLPVGGVEKMVIFEEPGETMSPLTGEIVTTAPQISGPTADLGSVERGTEVVRGGITYYVVSPPRNDGMGDTTLILSKDP
ncbi:MAG: hypothetical protein AB7D06_08915 [Pedobacter sp.]